MAQEIIYLLYDGHVTFIKMSGSRKEERQGGKMSFADNVNDVTGKLKRIVDLIDAVLKPIGVPFEDFMRALNNKKFLLELAKLIVVTMPFITVDLGATSLITALEYNEGIVEDARIRSLFISLLEPVRESLISGRFYELDRELFFGDHKPTEKEIEQLITDLGFRSLTTLELIALRIGLSTKHKTLVLHQPEPSYNLPTHFLFEALNDEDPPGVPQARHIINCYFNFKRDTFDKIIVTKD